MAFLRFGERSGVDIKLSNNQWHMFDQFLEDYRMAIKATFAKGEDSLKQDIAELIELYSDMEGSLSVPAYKTKTGEWCQFVFSVDVNDDGQPIIQYSHFESQ